MPGINDGNKPSKNHPAPNTEAELLFDAVKEALHPDNLEKITDKIKGNVIIGSLNTEEKSKLEEMNSSTDKAQVIFTLDDQGAVILSSTGAIKTVGLMPDHHNNLTNENYSKIAREVLKALDNDEVISEDEGKRLEELDTMLKDIGMVISDDRKSVAIACSNGHWENINIAELKAWRRNGRY